MTEREMRSWVRRNCRFAQWEGSPMESDQAGARARGAEHPERAWILGERDTWYRNPYYKGPPVPHPESVEPEDRAGDPPARPEPRPEPRQTVVEDDPNSRF